MTARFVTTILIVVLGAALSDTAEKENPMTKVINLLKDMQGQLAKDQKEDEEVYDKMVCWCQTNDKLKTESIAAAKEHLSDLGETIEELTARSAQLKIDIETLTDETKASEKALSTSTAIRTQESSEFKENEQTAVQTISGLAGAVTALKGHHSSPGAEVEDEGSPEAFLQVRRNSNMLRSAVAQPVASKSYDSQSGAIFGILRTMKEKFEGNLATAQEEEAAASTSFADMKAAKTEELKAARAQLKEKTHELADADENLSNSKADEVDTSAQLEADSVFLADLKKRCATMDADWTARKEMRAEEVTAVSEALSILWDDEASDLAHKTVGSSFVQVTSSRALRRAGVLKQGEVQRLKAAALLRSMAVSLHTPSLGNLATLIQTSDVFEGIKKEITKLVATLKKDQQEEVKQKDECKESLHKNEMELTEGYDTKEDIEGKIEDLTVLVGQITKGIAAAKAEMLTTQQELKKAAENRAAENLDFQMTISDQRATQVVLAKALKKLQDFYASKAKESALIQGKQAPPAGFKPYKKAGGAGGVVGFIQNIVAESQKVEKEARAAEQEAQAGYEEFVSSSNEVFKTLTQSLADMADQKAKADQDMVVAKEEQGTNLSNLASLSDINEELHGECDYVLHNFSVRQSKRGQEIESLQTAYQMLSGMAE